MLYFAVVANLGQIDQGYLYVSNKAVHLEVLRLRRYFVPSDGIPDAPAAFSSLRPIVPKHMSREAAPLNTYHRCGTQERELHKGSSTDGRAPSTKYVSDTSGVCPLTDID